MAGTASGIAKARAAKASRDAERRQQEQSQQDVFPPVGTMLPAVGLVGPVGETETTKGQRVAEAFLDALAPEAAAVLASSMRRGDNPRLRLTAAKSVLGLTVGRDRPQGRGTDQSTSEEFVARMAQAYRLRMAAARAVDAQPIGDNSVPSEACKPQS